MSDIQADLTERARALVEEFRAYLCEKMIDLDEPEIEWMTDKLEAVLQSEREAALMDGGEWRTKLAEQIGKTQAAAAEAHRADIAVLEKYYADIRENLDWPGQATDSLGVLDCAINMLRDLASPPAPQEET